MRNSLRENRSLEKCGLSGASRRKKKKAPAARGAGPSTGHMEIVMSSNKIREDQRFGLSEIGEDRDGGSLKNVSEFEEKHVQASGNI